MYAAVGTLPHDARDVTAETLTELNELAQDEKVVALDKTGLDFHYNFSSQSDQKRAFAAQDTAKTKQEAINKVIWETGGNREKAAEMLGIGRKTLYRKLR
jgi:Tat protein secretion system quality control protein TatD with DNase activity